MTAPNRQELIDCDVHPVLHSFEELASYLDEAMQSYMNIGKFFKRESGMQNGGAFKFPCSPYGNPLPYALRANAYPPGGGLPGSDPEFLAKDLFDRMQTTCGILNIGHGTMAAYHNVEVASRYTSAINDWLYEKWVKSDSRYRMTMEVTPLDPLLSIREIERIGKKPGIVGINFRTLNIPMGKRCFWPIYEVAQEYGLPIVIHPDSEGTGDYAPPLAVGPASTYAEWHSCLPLIAQREVISLVCEGVLEKFPKLKFAFLEYGFAWIGPLMWRLDKNWKALRHEIPWVKELPSEYIRRGIRLGTQPIEEPFNPKDLVELIHKLKVEDMLLFCSDYPHWDEDIIDAAFLHFDEDLKTKIFYKNAMDCYQIREKVSSTSS